MVRIARPLTNNDILKAKPQEKDFTLHDGVGFPCSSKRLTRSYGGFATSAQQVAAEHILAQALTVP